MISITFNDLVSHTPAWVQWRQENAAFLQTPEGQAVLTRMQTLKAKYQANENWWNTQGKKKGLTAEYNNQKNRLLTGFREVRTNFTQSPTNPANQTAAPGAAPTAAMPTAGPVAPPVYLPTVNAPQYMFPSAEAVKDMTYDPGIGGYLRPNQWQGAVPANPYSPQSTPSTPQPVPSGRTPQPNQWQTGVPSTPQQPSPGAFPTGAFPTGGVPWAPPQVPGLQPPGSMQGQSPGFPPGQMPMGGQMAQPGQFPWQPGY